MIIVLLLLVLSGGAALGIQSASNGSLSSKIGVLETALLTFVSGAAILFLLVLFFGSGEFSKIFTVPKWQLSAVFLGVLFLSLLVLTVPKIGVVGAGIATIAGQLIAGMIIDHFGVIGLHIPMTTSRYIAVVALILAIVCIFKSHQFAKITSQNALV